METMRRGKGRLIETIEWISVKERLPELKNGRNGFKESEEVLFVEAVGVESLLPGSLSIGILRETLEGDLAWIRSSGWLRGKVSHWAEAPHPEHMGIRTGKING